MTIAAVHPDAAFVVVLADGNRGSDD